MNRYAIQDKMIIQYDGTHDNYKIKYALDTAKNNGNRETVDVSWRWLCDDLSELYDTEPEIASACLSWINGWVHGVSYALSKAFINFLK